MHIKAKGPSPIAESMSKILQGWRASDAHVLVLWQRTTLLAYTKGINQNKYTMIIDTASIYQYNKQSSFFNVEMMQNNDLVIKQNIFLFNLKTSPIHPVKAQIIHIESVTYNSGLVS